MKKYYQNRRRAFGYAITGLIRFFREEDHPKIHLVATFLVILAGIILQVSTVEWLVLILCIVLVIGLEAVNSALEQLTDIASPDYLEAAGRVKDLAAGAVLIVTLGAATAGCIIFFPKIIELL